MWGYFDRGQSSPYALFDDYYLETMMHIDNSNVPVTQIIHNIFNLSCCLQLILVMVFYVVCF